MISVGLTGWPSWRKNFNVAIFSDTINVISAKLCMGVVLIELCPFIPLSVTLTVFQGHGRVKVLTENFMCISD